MDLPAKARRLEAIRRHEVLVGVRPRVHISEASSPSYRSHVPHSVCKGGISGGRDVQERRPAHRLPEKESAFEKLLKAQRVALQRKFEEHLNACSSAATTAPEPPRIDSDCGKEKRPLAAESGVVQELVPAHRPPMEDCSFERTGKAQRVAPQRKFEEHSMHLDACASAATTAPKPPCIDSACGEFPMHDGSFERALKAQAIAIQRTIETHLKACASGGAEALASTRADSDCVGEEERVLAAECGVVQEFVAARRFPVKDCSFECTVKAQAVALQRKFEEHLKQLNACSSAATAPEPPRIDSDCGKEKRPLAAESRVVQELVPARRPPMKDCSFERTVKAQAVAPQRKFEEHSLHLNACASAATTAPEPLCIDFDCGEFPMHDGSFECALKAQAIALQRTIETHLKACASGGAEALDYPRADSDCVGEEERPLAAAGTSGHCGTQGHG